MNEPRKCLRLVAVRVLERVNTSECIFSSSVLGETLTVQTRLHGRTTL